MLKKQGEKLQIQDKFKIQVICLKTYLRVLSFLSDFYLQSSASALNWSRK